MSRRGISGRRSRGSSASPLHLPKEESLSAQPQPPFSALNLDPQFDEIINTLSDEVAKLGPMDSAGHASTPSWWMPAFGELTYAKLRREVRWGLRTASAITVVGVLGCLCSIPELSQGLVPFSFPLLIMSLFCCMLGGSCWSMALLANRVLANSHSATNYSPALAQTSNMMLGERRGWLSGMEAVCWLLGVSILLWVGMDFLMASGASPNYAWMIRRGLAGLFFASASMQLQFIRMLRTSLQR